jgi:DNA mismatch endonuclease, patch repair protein
MPRLRLAKSTVPDQANQATPDAPRTRGTDGQSWATSPATRKAMQANRRRDTAPEMAIRRLVHARGLRYRVDARPLPSARHTADMIFTRAQVAVFIDGCWWHGCAEHYRPPASNITYWSGKVARNQERDRLADQALSAAGWTVVRIWEHEAPESAALRIEAVVRSEMRTRNGKHLHPDEMGTEFAGLR